MTTNPYYADEQVTLHLGKSLDVLAMLPDESVNCIVTSPPYFHQRDYEVEGQYGLEESPAEYVEIMRAVFSEARRVLAKDGTLWLNLGDSYSGSWGNQSRHEGSPGLVPATDGRFPKTTSRTGAIKPGAPAAKNLYGIPWRVALALQDDGWILRNAIVWEKTNAMPESVTDRLAGRYEQVFLFSRSPRYWFDLDAIRQPHAAPQRTPGATAFRARNASHRRSATKPYQGPGERGANPGDVWRFAAVSVDGHFAAMPPGLAVRCIKAGCRPGGTVLDPFSGSGTTGTAARLLGHRYVGIDLKTAYHDLAIEQFAQGVLDLSLGAA